MPDEHSDKEEQERRRPRVVDKRVSARPEGTAEETADVSKAPIAADAVSDPDPQEEDSPRPSSPPEEVWTPEQEAEARRVAEEIARTPAVEWVVNSAVTLANVAAAKLDGGNLPDAQIAIDGLTGILKEVGHRLGNVEQPLRQTLSQLQMAYAEIASGSGQAPPGDE